MATIYGTVKNETTVEALLELYKEYYDQETFIRVREKRIFPENKRGKWLKLLRYRDRI